MDRLERRLEEALQGRAPTPGRVRTHVEGLDALLGGGIPPGHVVLLHGPSGTLKTSLALRILAQNRERGDRRLYLSLQERRSSLLATMRGLGLPEEDFVVDLAAMRRERDLGEKGREWLEILTRYLERKAEEGLDLLVIDPLDTLYEMAREEVTRQELFAFFTFLREVGVTALLIHEGPGFPRNEDRLADGVLAVEEREVDGRVELWIRCAKMRHARHSRDYHRLAVQEGQLVVSPLPDGG